MSCAIFCTWIKPSREWQLNRRVPREQVPHRLSDWERVAEYRRNGKPEHLRRRRESERQRRVLETAEQKEARLFKRRERARERRQAETAEEREALLIKRRTIDRALARCQTLSAKQTEERLQLLYKKLFLEYSRIQAAPQNSKINSARHNFRTPNYYAWCACVYRPTTKSK